MIQRVPFQCSTRVWLAVPAELDPTASQTDARRHDTPQRSVLAPALGLRTTTHRPPFHCSTRVREVAPVTWPPTASQNRVEAHATAFKRSWVLGSLVGATRKEV